MMSGGQPVQGLVGLSVLATALAATACGTRATRGPELYHEGRYIEAAEVFERTEYRLRRASPPQRVEYSLYRGMTFLALGDLRNAHRWLSIAHQAADTHPGVLSGSQLALLQSGWSELQQHGASQQPAPGPSGPALAATRGPVLAPGSNGRRSVAPPQSRSLVPR